MPEYTTEAGAVFRHCLSGRHVPWMCCYEKLSDFSKLETGNMPMEPVATDFGAFLQEMLDDNEQYLREKDVNVIFLYRRKK